MKVNNVKSFEYRTDLLGGVDKFTNPQASQWD